MPRLASNSQRYQPVFAAEWATPLVTLAQTRNDAVGAAALRLLVQLSCDTKMRNALAKAPLAGALLGIAQAKLRYGGASGVSAQRGHTRGW